MCPDVQNVLRISSSCELHTLPYKHRDSPKSKSRLCKHTNSEKPRTEDKSYTEILKRHDNGLLYVPNTLKTKLVGKFIMKGMWLAKIIKTNNQNIKKQERTSA